MNRIARVGLVAMLGAACAAPASRGQGAPDGSALSHEALARRVDEAAARLRAGEAREAARMLLPLRATSEDPRLREVLTEAMSRAAYDTALRLEAREPGATPAARPGEPDRALAEQHREAIERLERTIAELTRRLESAERALADHGRALPITDRLEQSLGDVQRDVRDLRRQLDSLDRAVEQLRWKK